MLLGLFTPADVQKSTFSDDRPQVLLGSRRDRFFSSVSATEWRGIPLLFHHRLTPDELQFVHDRAVDWPEELRLRILHNLPERAVSDDWKIPRCRADSLLTNSHI